jgi:broad specificity phosphatase PhoE
VSNSQIAPALLDRLQAVPGVVSASVVGSLADGADLANVSDIDTIVICDRLTREVFEACQASVAELTAEELGGDDRELYVNSTFGPLKFDTARQLVIHLMIYDVAGHRRHVIKSPFTCFDWERTRVHVGPHLAEIYPVLALQPRDFLAARRGIDDYIQDLDRGVISYRRYSFESGAPVEVSTTMDLDRKHRGEYAYHIIRNLVCNYTKLLSGQNDLHSEDEMVHQWCSRLQSLADFVPFYQALREIKIARGEAYPDDVVDRVRDFAGRMSELLRKTWDRAPVVRFVRHGRTALNDGSFLGQGRDPGLEPGALAGALDGTPDRVFCSPLRRCVESAEILVPEADLVIDDRLREINYGDAEGLTPALLAEAYPEMSGGWVRGDDPRFPSGENSADVAQRMQTFIDDLQPVAGEQVLVVSHNVVIRSFVGRLLNLQTRDWFKLRPGHGDVLETAWYDGRLFPNFAPEQKAAFTDDLVGYGQEGSKDVR